MRSLMRFAMPNFAFDRGPVHVPLFRHERSEHRDGRQLDEPPFATTHRTRRTLTARKTYRWQAFRDPHQTTQLVQL